MWYWSVFISSFLSATLLPLGSEVAFVLALETGEAPFWLMLIATLGNTLGGMTNFVLGYFAKWQWLEKYLRIREEKVAKLSAKVKPYGSAFALLCWLPIIGDPLAVALGLLKLSPTKTTVYMFVGKGLRYVGVYLIWKLTVSS